MRFVQRGTWALFLLTCLTSPIALFAQEDGLAVAGSGIANPLFTALADDAGLTYDINTTGTDVGLDQFCNGQVQMTTATRALTIPEEQLCEQNGVIFSEMLLGYEVLAFIAHPERTDEAACLTTADLNALLSPTAIETATWQAFAGEEDDVQVNLGELEAEATAEAEVAPIGDSINVYLPPANTSTYAFLDQTITGIGFRADAQTLDSEAGVIDAVADDDGGFGVVRLSLLANAEAEGVITSELQNPELGRCVEPSAESASDISYMARQPIYIYVADAVRDNEDVAAFLDTITNPDNAATVTAAGFTAPTGIDYEISQEARLETGRQFSRSVTEYQIPPSVAGTVTVEGGAAGFSLINSTVGVFTQQYQNVTIAPNLDGVPIGLRRLCNGEIDVAITYEPLSQETLDNCEAIDINVLEVEIGQQVAVLVANEADDYLTCLTTGEIASVWGATAQPITNWQTVNGDYPDQEFILFAGSSLGDPIPNFMLVQAAGSGVPLREDVETDRDPLYRAAAVANVPGSLTYMTWADYQAVLENEQGRIQLVAVDAGQGCITPTEETILTGEYPLTRTLRLAISRRALERVEVQSFLWFMFEDDRFGQFENNNFDLLTLRDLANIRDTLQTAYEEAQAAAVEREAAAATQEAIAATDEPSDITDIEVDITAEADPVETEAASDEEAAATTEADTENAEESATEEANSE